MPHFTESPRLSNLFKSRAKLAEQVREIHRQGQRARPRRQVEYARARVAAKRRRIVGEL